MTSIQRLKLRVVIIIFALGGLLFLSLGRTLSVLKSAGWLLIYMGIAFTLAYLLMNGWKKLKGGN